MGWLPVDQTKPLCIGRSSDGRTNRWAITCPKCGHRFEPRTTMFATQELECPKPKCGAEMLARYASRQSDEESVTLFSVLRERAKAAEAAQASMAKQDGQG